MPFLQALSVLWSYVRRYAWIAFAILSFTLAYILFKRPASADLAKQLEDIQRLHDEELQRIKDADASKLQQEQENQRKLEEALAFLDEQHRQALAKLDAEQKATIDEIVSKSGDDPSALAEQLAKQLGLSVAASGG